MSYRYESIYFDDPIVLDRAMDIFCPRKITRDTAVLFVHGGGWRAGTRQFCHALMQAFRNKGYICAATDYRLAGVNIFDQITDVRHGYDIFQTHLKEKGYASRVAVFGESAGGHLAALLCFANPGECGEDLTFCDYTYQQEWTPPIGVALQAVPMTFEPWEDIFPPIWNSMQNIIGTPYEVAPELYRQVSPIKYVNRKTCPTFVLNAENEHMFPHEINKPFFEKMNSCGRRSNWETYKTAEHGFFYDITRRPQKEAFGDLLEFLETLTNK